MRFILCLFLLMAFFYSNISFAQPYLSEIENYDKFKYTIKEINAAENPMVKDLEEEFARNQSVDMELRVYPTAFDTNSTLLLYLKSPAHTAQLSIIDILGNVVDIPLEDNLNKGFYEISILPNTKAKGVFIARLMIDGKAYAKYIIR